MDERLDDLADRLDGVAADLADAAMAALHDAIADGETKSPVEKRITRARRSVEKAAALLREDPASTGSW